MTVTLPIKNLIRLNLLLALIVSAIVSLFLFFDRKETHAIIFTVMTAAIIGFVGFAHIYILIFLARKFGVGSKKFKRYRYLLTYAVSIAVYVGVWPIFAFFSDRSTWSFWGMLSILIVSGALVNTLLIILQDLILLQSEKAQADLEFSKLKTAHAEAANLLLKQQIHPHFLFNALNTLKALYRMDSSIGDTYIVHLADFLRASIYSHSAKVSKLDEELTLLRDYLEMQKIRFGSALVFTTDIPIESLNTYFVPSFSLQPLLENAIKHNELTEEAPLKVSVYQDNGRIVVCNNLQKKTIMLSSTNYGLANLAERYRLLSGDEIIIEEEQNEFRVSIKLLTNEYSDY